MGQERASRQLHQTPPKMDDKNKLSNHLPPIRFGDPQTCTYCGEPAEALDHVIPFSFLTCQQKRLPRHRNEGITTWACNDCNSLLGARYFSNWAARVTFVSSHNLKRLKKNKTPHWSEEELEEVDHSLRTFIEEKQGELRRDRRRASWVGSVEWDDHLRELWGIPQLQKTDERYHPFLGSFFGVDDTPPNSQNSQNSQNS